MKTVIVGAGGHGQVVADIFRDSRFKQSVEIVFVDDRPGLAGISICGIPVVGPVSMLRSLPHDGLIVAVGENHRRAKLTAELTRHERFVTAIHGSSVIADSVQIGEGTMICAGVIVNTASVIGRGAILNTACTVDHHTVIGDFAHIAPGVHMGGEVHVGDRALIGIGATVLPRIRIGSDAVVGGGAVVTRDVPDGTTVVGVPARPILVPATN